MTSPDLDDLPVALASELTVPLIDLAAPQDACVTAVAGACRNWGLFLVTNHDIAKSDIDAMLATASNFFAAPLADKRRLLRTLDNPWGFYDSELTKNRLDRKEIFDISPTVDSNDDSPFQGQTPWPDDPVFVDRMMAHSKACEALAARLMALIADGLGIAAADLAGAFRPAPTSFLRLNFYPVGDFGADDRGVHHHSDAGVLTVLLEDGTPGLQVLKDGQWHHVNPVPGAFIINIGDMMQVWSNDRYRAPIHRVVAMQTADRFSIPYFYNPSYAAVVAPLIEAGTPKYRPINWAEYRRRRAEGDFGDYGREVQISDYALPQGPA